jgi:pSer/pThr/pTyr-binding forkhead associated (FHA) protein
MRSRSATLVSLNGQPDIRIEANILLVGRSSECDVVVDSKKISRKHCCLVLVDDYLIVRDLGSTNGCRLNGQRSEEFRARSGDEVAVADLNYRLEPDGAAKTKDAAPPRITDTYIERSDGPILLPEEEEPAPRPPRNIDSSDSLAVLPGIA